MTNEPTSAEVAAAMEAAMEAASVKIRATEVDTTALQADSAYQDPTVSDPASEPAAESAPAVDSVSEICRHLEKEFLKGGTMDITRFIHWLQTRGLWVKQ